MNVVEQIVNHPKVTLGIIGGLALVNVGTTVATVLTAAHDRKELDRVNRRLEELIAMIEKLDDEEEEEESETE